VTSLPKAVGRFPGFDFTASAAEFLNFFHGFGKSALRFRREGFAEIKLHRRSELEDDEVGKGK
jgi:hypothetical protein